MKIYNSNLGAATRALRVILSLKQVSIKIIDIDMASGENRNSSFLKINPAGVLPCLELDNGKVIGEVNAIAEYLDEVYPKNLISGSTPEERAETRMRMRQCDWLVIVPLANAFRHGRGKKFFSGRINIYESLSDPSLKLAKDGMEWINTHLQENKYLCGLRISYADIVFYSMIKFLLEAIRISVKIDFPYLYNYIEKLDLHEGIGNIK
tara:strand:+ start:120 stop:743 length:624 start_codon:yes stop_codon:yes gene_type:complete